MTDDELATRAGEASAKLWMSKVRFVLTTFFARRDVALLVFMALAFMTIACSVLVVAGFWLADQPRLMEHYHPWLARWR